MIPYDFIDDGNGTIWLDRIDCSGSPHKLINCSYSIDTSYCSHRYDAGVKCYLSCPSEEDEGRLRFVTGSIENIGRLEINYRGEWGTICSTHFGHDDAEVACRQLGYWSFAFVTGSIENIGRLEINYRGEWGTICSTHFGHV
ncbi:Hypothetical predicted protein [Mytilus galloprovincialis]|uniref:SRCR domain-containing protein n=1 Tax=Mytilus galloprovincialis TaxID=29158 RepID=A0A8B6DCB0_MYTGA|nr:Hypothetical predicted protein [Mytilus galloprovincialis]